MRRSRFFLAGEEARDSGSEGLSAFSRDLEASAAKRSANCFFANFAFFAA